MVCHGNTSQTGLVLDQGLKTADGFDFKIGTPLYYIQHEYDDDNNVVGGTVEIQSTHGCKIVGASLHLPSGFFGQTIKICFVEYVNAKAQLKQDLKQSIKKQMKVVNQILDFLEKME